MENGRNVRNTHENTKKHKESENDEKQSKTLVCKLDFFVMVIRFWEPAWITPTKKGKQLKKEWEERARKQLKNKRK